VYVLNDHTISVSFFDNCQQIRQIAILSHVLSDYLCYHIGGVMVSVGNTEDSSVAFHFHTSSYTLQFCVKVHEMHAYRRMERTVVR